DGRGPRVGVGPGQRDRPGGTLGQAGGAAQLGAGRAAAGVDGGGAGQRAAAAGDASAGQLHPADGVAVPPDAEGGAGDVQLAGVVDDVAGAEVERAAVEGDR